jgi:enamine deaminase RidA (YjgF/YER057c/UK114 family)
MPSARATPATAVRALHSSIARNASTSRDTRKVARAAVPAVSAFAATVGYSRALRDGRHVYVSGTAPVGIDSVDPYEQAKRCLEIILDALRQLGAGPEHVVRTRIFIVDRADWEAVARAHGEVFGSVLPATSMLVISGLLDPSWKVEIEADALLPE